MTTLTPLGPAPEMPDRDLVSSWSMASMQGYLDALDRAGLYRAASRAVQLECSGAPHLAVMLALAGAEMAAARIGAEELAIHAARLDAYVDAYELRGWYRDTDFRGKHVVQVNKIRTAADGNLGRYYVHHVPLTPDSEKPHWVIDRDTGRTATRHATSQEANAWIVAAGGEALAGKTSVETVKTAAGLL